ncbi:MAG: aminotransferase class I/II-fold pyridoxal phosphate-dependent enzyme [Solirubrobacterales bacterium]
MNQQATPLFDAVKQHIRDGVIPFHVPGHKYGRGIAELRECLGDQTLMMDLNGMKDLDYASNPSGVIAEAQQLAASAFGADDAYFLVNGTTSGVQTMIMSACAPGSEIILPRNAHRSTIGGIILSGAIPVYVQPEIHPGLGIAMGVSVESVSRAIRKHPHASAVFVINPTYYGAASDLVSIVNLAHFNNMAVLADEAHGAHMYFHDDFPITAMAAGADMSAASIHKTAGSLTQSSILLHRTGLVPPEKVAESLRLHYTSSASYLLLCSLDVARKQLGVNGRAMLEQTLQLSRRIRERLNTIPELYAFGPELVGSPGCFGFDETKLGIHCTGLGLTGYQTEAVLRDKYRIQVELSDMNNILALMSIGDSNEAAETLVKALQDLALSRASAPSIRPPEAPHCPEVIVSPRDAFYSPKKVLRLESSIGEVAGEMVMAYPPGIPVICMGERITAEIVDYIKLLKEQRCELQGAVDPEVNTIRVLGQTG